MSEPFAIGLDLGGTELKSGRVGATGTVERFGQRPSGARDHAEATVEAIVSAYRELAEGAEGQVIGVGVGIPGVIEPATGSLVGATPNLPHWADHPVRDTLRAALGCDVAVDNDANLAALGEHRCGAARGARLSLTITVGTGVGCGIVADGRVLRGAHGGAGEIGHVPLGDGRLACGCEVHDCVEPEMCADGLLRRAHAAGVEARDAAAIFAAAARGEAPAQDWVERMADRLGAVLGTAINLLNPDAVVLGGGVSNAGAQLLDPVRAAIERYSLASHRRDLRIAQAELGNRAGVVGAGLTAWEVAQRRRAASD